MKKLIAIALLLGATTAQAGLLDIAQGMLKKTVTPIAEYAVETSGYNIRAYEWRLQSDPRFTCIYTAGEEGGGSTQCFKANN